MFMARSDVAYSVRTAAVHVWKTVVTNTPRTTTEILPVLMGHLIEALGSPGAKLCKVGCWATCKGRAGGVVTMPELQNRQRTGSCADSVAPRHLPSVNTADKCRLFLGQAADLALTATPAWHAMLTMGGSPSATGEDRRQMSASCLGELVRKMGERVLYRILPILQASQH